MGVISTVDAVVRQGGQPQRSGHRRDRTAVALFLLFVLMLVEPLACITYCHAGTELRAHEAFAAQHQPHELAIHTGMAAELAEFRPVVLLNLFVCFTHGGHNAPADQSTSPSPLMLHEHQATTVAVILFLLVLIAYPSSHPTPFTPPHQAIRPLLRPPIRRATTTSVAPR